jgi:hypothetical protein
MANDVARPTIATQVWGLQANRMVTPRQQTLPLVLEKDRGEVVTRILFEGGREQHASGRDSELVLTIFYGESLN